MVRAAPCRYVQQLHEQLTHAKFARTAIDTHVSRLQDNIARISSIISNCDVMLGGLTQTECWRPQ